MKTVLITGASRGIGRAAAKAFAEAGYAVAANFFKSESHALSLRQEILSLGGRAEIFRADVSDAKAVADMAKKVRAEFGSIDVLVANAGVSLVKQINDVTPAEWDELFAINTRGVFNAVNAVVGGMISKKRGRIIAVSSIFGRSGASCEAAYSASKAAVIGLVQGLARELGPSGITVNCVAPGVIDTEMNNNLTADERAALADEIPLGRFGKAEEVASAILFLASDAASYISGETLGVSGGF